MEITKNYSYDENGDIEDEIFSGIEYPNVIKHADIVQKNINPHKMITPTNEIDQKILRSCLIYFMYTYDDDITELIESTFPIFCEVAEECIEKIKNRNCITLIPGDSPLLVWFAMQYQFSEIQDYILFPISGIKDYSNEEKNKLRTKSEKLRAYLLNNENAFNDSSEYIKSLGEYNEVKKQLDDFDLNKSNQRSVITKYLKRILQGKDMSKDVLYIDYIAHGRLLTQLKDSLKILRHTGSVEQIHVKQHLIDESRRCTTGFKLNKIREFLKSGTRLEDIEHNYLRCNVILYIFNSFLNNRDQLIQTINGIRNELKIYTKTEVEKFKGRYVNIDYVKTYEGFRGSTVQIFLQMNVLLEDVSHKNITLSGEIVNIPPRYILDIQELEVQI